MTKYLSNHFVNYIKFFIGCCLSRSCYAASPLSINQLKHFNIHTSTGNFFGLNMASASHRRKQINEERRIIRTASRNVQLLNSQVEQVRANAQHESLGDSTTSFEREVCIAIPFEPAEDDSWNSEYSLEPEREDVVRTNWEWDDIDRNSWEWDNDEIETSIFSDSDIDDGNSSIDLHWESSDDSVLIFEVDASHNDPALTFREQLANWAVLPGVHHVHVNKLLSILKSHPCHSSLPSDVRTLLKTPRKVQLTKVHPGEYYHFGVLSGLLNVLSLTSLPPVSFSVEMMIDIDGLPICKSTNRQLWVILGVVRNFPQLQKFPIVIGIYCGYEKPAGGPNSFLKAFVDEMIGLIEKGFDFEGHHFQITKVIFVCDAPARAFITGVKYHSGFSSCPKCITVGETALKPSEIRNQVQPKGRRVFPCISSALRTDYSFRKRHDQDHHNYYSCLEDIKILDMVLDIPLDPMHLVDEGAGRKLFMTLIEDSDYKISPFNVRRVNEEMASLSRYTPRDFARKSRPFSGKFKATEWSQALKYTCPVVFRNRLSEERYVHMLSLHVAVKILSSQRFCFRYNSYAKSLLQNFVENCSRLYGKSFISFNIHCLIHLADEVLRFGPLNTFSAYVFENKLGAIKRLLRKSERPLQQIVKRIAELEVNKTINITLCESNFRSEHRKGPLLPRFQNCKQYSIFDLNNFTLTSKVGDNCVLLLGKIVVVIENLVVDNEEPFIIGKRFRDLRNLYPEPFDSTLFDIFHCRELSQNLEFWPLDSVQFKMYMMPLSGLSSFAAFPIENL